MQVYKIRRFIDFRASFENPTLLKTIALLPHPDPMDLPRNLCLRAIETHRCLLLYLHR